ncbi:hypothetical protein D3C76_1257680 [compost metagenome]
MDDLEKQRLELMISRMCRLNLLQIESLMNLSSAILHIDGIGKDTRNDAYKVFTGIQAQLDMLTEIQNASFKDE